MFNRNIASTTLLLAAILVFFTVSIHTFPATQVQHFGWLGLAFFAAAFLPQVWGVGEEDYQEDENDYAGSTDEEIPPTVE